MPHLQILRLRSNIFSGHIPKNITDLGNLHFLDIAHNNISGTLPDSLANFKAMTVIAQNKEEYIFEESIPVITKDQQRDYTFEIYNQNCSISGAQQSVYEDTSHMGPLYLGMSIGFVIGLWTVFCTMLMKRTWMMAYFQIIDKIYDKAYVQVAISWSRLMQKKQDAALSYQHLGICERINLEGKLIVTDRRPGHII
uniref:Uncharacterized protein n=1 Tax=Oryza punctata TaxID=4537 RepID=A0A0E0JKT8_ORYPU